MIVYIHTKKEIPNIPVKFSDTIAFMNHKINLESQVRNTEAECKRKKRKHLRICGMLP